MATFAEVTEAPGVPLAAEAASMLVTRYAFAARAARGARTLELACGGGAGLRLLAGSAAWVAGADIDQTLLSRAGANHGRSIPLVRLSAGSLPFADGSFECVVMMEASYYVADFALAAAEIARVLAPNGRLAIVNANPERPDFIRSPLSTHYHSAAEFRALLESRGFDVEVSAAFPVASMNGSLRSRGAGVLVRSLRRLAERSGLVPRTLAGRAILKRLLGQRLRSMPEHLELSLASEAALEPVATGPVTAFKTIYILATRTATA